MAAYSRYLNVVFFPNLNPKFENWGKIQSSGNFQSIISRSLFLLVQRNKGSANKYCTYILYFPDIACIEKRPHKRYNYRNGGIMTRR